MIYIADRGDGRIALNPNIFGRFVIFPQARSLGILHSRGGLIATDVYFFSTPHVFNNIRYLTVLFAIRDFGRVS